VRKRIGTGLSDGTRTEVTSGLQASEEVVKAGAASIVEGQAVEIARPAAQPEAKEGAKASGGAKP
jgi:hypothetical protein